MFGKEHKNVFIRYEDGSEFVVDLVEKSPAYLKVVKQVEEEADKKLEASGMSGQMGSCYGFWGYKKEILKKKYNIVWRSPKELNEEILFD